MKTKTTGLFSGIPQKAIILGSKFILTGNLRMFQICYMHNGKTVTQSIKMEGGNG